MSDKGKVVNGWLVYDDSPNTYGWFNLALVSDDVPESASTSEFDALLDRIYKRHSAGCCLHLAVDDGNLDDDSVQFCYGYASAKEHDDCVAVARLLCAMTEEERERAVGAHHDRR